MATKFKSGDRVAFEYGNEIEVVTLDDCEYWGFIDCKVWTVKELDSQFYYQETYLRKLTPLEELL